ncbi:MAG: hypothetical protein HY238_25625 [Acidobacteria bacterium]|nr:hypothetical protein [Acidobacteriota bacterium]
MNRRHFLASTAGALAAAPTPAMKTVAAIITEYRYYSHADVIVGRILAGYTPNGVRVEPRTRIVSMYTDQIAAKDMSRDLAAKHGFKIYPTVAGAMTLGGAKLAVDAVLLVGEHGEYPTNEKGQKMYPRFELYQRIIEVFRRSGRVTPLFSDKHLSYSWQKAKMMYDQARELKIPFMAGSSIPVTVRVPELEIPLDTPIERAVAVGYGDLDAYGFHTLETLQCMVERRAGGEKGIAAVEMLEADAVWRWRDSSDGKWSVPLLAAALARNPKVKAGPPEQNVKKPALFLLEYRDGFRSAVYMLNGQISGWVFAAKLKDRLEPVSTNFGVLDERRPLVHFDGLVHCIEELFVSGRPVYPVERTLLTTGALAFLFESRQQKRRIETPELKVSYRAPRHAYFQRS